VKPLKPIGWLRKDGKGLCDLIACYMKMKADVKMVEKLGKYIYDEINEKSNCNMFYN
jgi:hypothetical protein